MQLPETLETLTPWSSRWPDFCARLERALEEAECDRDFELTLRVITDMDHIDFDSTLGFFREELGVRCDCLLTLTFD